MIRMEKVETLNQRLLFDQAFQEYVEAFRRDEPYLYSWMKVHANNVVDMMIKTKKTIDPQLLTSVYENICRAYLFMHHVSRMDRDLLVEKVTAADHFQSFLDGELDERFYQYSTVDLAPESTLVLAKQAHHRRALQDLRKRLLPLLAEDVSRGQADDKTLRRIDGLDIRKAA